MGFGLDVLNLASHPVPVVEKGPIPGKQCQLLRFSPHEAARMRGGKWQVSEGSAQPKCRAAWKDCELREERDASLPTNAVE